MGLAIRGSRGSGARWREGGQEGPEKRRGRVHVCKLVLGGQQRGYYQGKSVKSVLLLLSLFCTVILFCFVSGTMA